MGIAPVFKTYRGSVSLLCWKDKVVFVKFGEKVQVFGFKNRELSDLYMRLFNAAVIPTETTLSQAERE